MVRNRGDAISTLPPVAGPGIIGSSVIDQTDVEKVMGSLKFADDLYFDGLLYGALVLSDVPHAEIRSVDTREAEALPGVVEVLTAKDVPGSNRFGLLTPDQPVLADEKVRFVGDVVALIIADTEEAARRAIGHIRVGLADLPLVDFPEKALESDLPPIHKAGHVLKRMVHQHGDVRAGFERAEVVVEQSYVTPFVEHAYLEPEAGVALMTEDARVEVWCSTQSPFYKRAQIAEILGLPPEKVRVRGMPVGGAFGGKLDVTIQALLALGALRTGRPVKITLTRFESFRMSTKRHPFRMSYKTGATLGGQFVALEAKLISDAGAYASWSTDVLEQAVLFGGGPYVWPHVSIEGVCVYTNNVIGGAFRGFGMNQVHFAIESQIDILAKRLGMDPIRIRLLNALEEGKETVAGEKLKSCVAVRETLLEAERVLGQNKRAKEAEAGHKRIGIGIASAYKNIGGGRGFTNIGGASLCLQKSGRIELRASICDMGQGACSILAQIASGATGIPYQEFAVIAGDTDLMPAGTAAIGQRQTMLAGNATVSAAREFKKLLLEVASEETGLPLDTLDIHGRNIVNQGREPVIPLKQLARIAEFQGREIATRHQWNAPQTYPLLDDPDPTYPIMKDGKRVTEYDMADYRHYFAYNYATQVAIVEVDTRTGSVEVKKVIAVHDVGKALNPQKIRGQLEGSIVMGIGYALSEEFGMRQGQPYTKTLVQCGIPTFIAIPEMEIHLIEKPEPIGPYHAKGISEIALVPTVPAIINAICDATGVRITSLPARPETILDGLREGSSVMAPARQGMSYSRGLK
jgi:CO/xanthine dehydrogenase Mo-binding subunit